MFCCQSPVQIISTLHPSPTWWQTFLQSPVSSLSPLLQSNAEPSATWSPVLSAWHLFIGTRGRRSWSKQTQARSLVHHSVRGQLVLSVCLSLLIMLYRVSRPIEFLSVRVISPITITWCDSNKDYFRSVTISNISNTILTMCSSCFVYFTRIWLQWLGWPRTN